MATVLHTLQDWGVNETARPVLMQHFTADECERLIRDDLFAGRTVSLELVAVVALGLLIGAIAVLSAI